MTDLLYWYTHLSMSAATAIAISILLVIDGAWHLFTHTVKRRRNARQRFIPNHSGIEGARQAPAFWMRDVKRGVRK
jgi:hypothetical protein